MMDPRTVLFVDDEAELLTALTRTFHREPYRVLTADGAGEALSILRSLPVDVIVCDEAMPGMLGTELLASIRQEFPSVVTILLTGYGSLDVARRAVNSGGVYRILSKPCDTVELTRAVREAMEHAALIGRMRRLVEESDGRPVVPIPRGSIADPLPTMFEVEDEPVDLQQLLTELEAQLGDAGRPPAAAGENEQAD